MSDLDTLRPEVGESLDRLGYFLTGTHNHNDLYAIQAELLRLSKENRILEIKNAGTLANNLCPDHRDKQVGRPCLACLIERTEAELAALKARMKPCARVRDGEVHVYMDTAHEGKEVAVVVVEE